MNSRKNSPLLRLEELQPAIPFRDVLLMGALVIGFAVLGALALPALLPDLAASFLGKEPKAYWFLSRSSGFVGLALLWLSMMFGVLITNRMARFWPGGPTAFDLHQFSSLLGLGFILFHIFILLGDKYINYSLADVLLPFRSPKYLPLWVGFGQLGFYLYLLVALSFYVRNLITQRGWRLLHYASFVLFVLAVIHSLLSGSDSDVLLVRLGYWLSVVSLLALIVVRVWVAVFFSRRD